MKLDSDCIRAVMLEIEREQRFFVNEDDLVEKECIWLDELCASLPKYKKEDVFYSLYNLDQAGYINMSVQWSNGCVYNCAINHMTYAGHEFLDRIRDTKKWSIIKGGLSAARDYSLSAISAVAEGVANAAINKYVETLKL